MQSIISNYVHCKNPLDKIKLVIYYKSPTVTSLVMRNNQAPATPELQQNNLIYEYNCTSGECVHLSNASYVGLTTTTLSRRITMHLQSGGPKDHACKKHQPSPLTRAKMVDNTKIIRRENDFSRLQRFEALYIQQKNPIINSQETGSSRTLKLFNFSNTARPQRLQLPHNNSSRVPHRSSPPAMTTSPPENPCIRRPDVLSQPTPRSRDRRRNEDLGISTSASQPTSRARNMPRARNMLNPAIPPRRSARLRNAT